MNQVDEANKRGMQNIGSSGNDLNTLQNPCTFNINESNKTPNAYETDIVIIDGNSNKTPNANEADTMFIDEDSNKTPNANGADAVIIDENNLNAEENKENESIDKHACNKDIAIKKVSYF